MSAKLDVKAMKELSSGENGTHTPLPLSQERNGAISSTFTSLPKAEFKFDLKPVAAPCDRRIVLCCGACCNC